MVGGGAFHVGVEVFGQEWSYGLAQSGTGVSAVEPREHPSHRFRGSLILGHTPLSQQEVSHVLSELARSWQGNAYHVVHRNCCAFAQEFCQKLGSAPVPHWVGSLGRTVASVVGPLDRAIVSMSGFGPCRDGSTSNLCSALCSKSNEQKSPTRQPTRAQSSLSFTDRLSSLGSLAGSTLERLVPEPKLLTSCCPQRADASTPQVIHHSEKMHTPSPHQVSPRKALATSPLQNCNQVTMSPGMRKGGYSTQSAGLLGAFDAARVYALGSCNPLGKSHLGTPSEIKVMSQEVLTPSRSENRRSTTSGGAFQAPPKLSLAMASPRTPRGILRSDRGKPSGSPPVMAALPSPAKANCYTEVLATPPNFRTRAVSQPPTGSPVPPDDERPWPPPLSARASAGLSENLVSAHSFEQARLANEFNPRPCRSARLHVVL